MRVNSWFDWMAEILIKRQSVLNELEMSDITWLPVDEANDNYTC